MAKLQGLQADYVFRGTEHVVRMTVNGSVLEVEVEDRLTTDQWRGEFDAAFIEDLTHKTGNFKQFGIFCSMLESALSQSSESVTLDLLTYTDLEALRSRKIGVGPRHAPSASKSSLLSSKRYLILIYSVEFDRIHYPLPLPYVGKPDPVALQKVIRELKEELAVLKAKPGRDFRDAEIRRLRDELGRVLEEKQEVESALLGLQEELKLSSKSSAGKEAKILKKIVQSLEEELLKERSKHQRAASKRLQENRQLADELAEVKASERSLRVRVKSLTNELALYKKGRAAPGRSSAAAVAREERRSTSGERSNSREHGGAWPVNRPRSTSREGRGGSQTRLPRQSPSPTGTRPPRFDPTAFVKAKEWKQKEAELKNQRRVRRGAGDAPPGSWGRSNSRGLAAFSGDSLGRSRGRSSSVESFRSQRSSASSGSEADDYSEPVPLRGRRRAPRGRKPLSSSSWNGPSGAPRADAGRRKRLASTPTVSKRADKGELVRKSAVLQCGSSRGCSPLAVSADPSALSWHEQLLLSSGCQFVPTTVTEASGPFPMSRKNLYDEPSADLSEIDARLQALQEYMNNLDTRT
ncbi:pre-B-cell leukemia transcription factor 2-like [Platysternon megacephalum]|uniref:Centrosomal protein CCDC61 n=1 Tax=Platysternon megacephalum TaxID=55544 RepID=A0A4D9DM48_9SAUR|nr:pre-B-cell leukemia transcription factor 2-like [Platysternon megacephalum]